MATFRGNYPVLGANVTCIGDIQLERRRIGNSAASTTIRSGSTSFLYSDVINGRINHTDIWSGGSRPANWFGPWGVTITGAPSIRIPDRLLEGRKIRVNNKPFNQRKRQGEIVVSNYRNINALLSYANGGPKTVYSTGMIEFTTSQLAPGFERPDYIWAQGLTDLSWSLRPAIDSLYATSNMLYPYENVEFTDDITPYDVGWKDDIIKDFIDSLDYPDSIHQLVLSNTADANTGTVDVLTSLAELPETVASILSGFLAIKKIILDAKAKKFSLLNKAKRVRIEAEARIRRVEQESYQAYVRERNARRRRIIEKERKQKIRQLQEDLKKSLLDITSAVAQVELTVRYGILPNVYTIEGLIQAFEEKDQIYKRWSSFRVDTVRVPHVPGFTPSVDTIEVGIRAFIKRQFALLSNNMDVMKNMSASLFVTAWELIPLSFVIDWFLNIGDILSTMLGSNLGGYKEAATISLKIEGGYINYLHKETGCSVNVQIKGYQRTVINPSDYCRLVWEPDVDGYRTYDALALSWNALRSTLSKGI